MVNYTYHRTGSFDQEELDDELVIMEIESQAIITLNPTGRLVWEMLEGAASRDEIQALIAEAFPDENRDSLKTDIQAVLDTLVAARLVTAESGRG
ncbi:MAG: PqqD family protein [Proteobacteria bacterium]|nr:PqqD family protein [Pseudomonadota bacterium]